MKTEAKKASMLKIDDKDNSSCMLASKLDLGSLRLARSHTKALLS